MYKYVVFDLDGTLIDSLKDIIAAVNMTMDLLHLDNHYDLESGKRLIGHGAKYLIKRAVDEALGNAQETDYENFSKYYLPFYKKCQENTKPFEGVITLLTKLQEKGVKTYVLTNKPHEATESIIKQCFASLISDFTGVSKGQEPKPSPLFTLPFLKKNNINPKECLYVGDSLVDLLTAENANIDSVLCLYGYDDYKNIDISKAKYKIYNPIDLLDLF